MNKEENNSFVNIVIGAVVLIALIAIFFLLSSSSSDIDDTNEAEPTTVVEQNDTLPTTVPDNNNDDNSDMSVTDDGSTETEGVVFDITGVNFEFSQETLTVTEGDTVTVNFRSESGFHDFVIDEFDAATDQVNPGTTTSVTFVADQVGSFEYYCSVGSHRALGMVGTLVVEAATTEEGEE